MPTDLGWNGVLSILTILKIKKKSRIKYLKWKTIF